MITETQHFLGKPVSEVTQKDIPILQDIIRYHRELYYQKEAPVISDQEFDELYKLLVDAEEHFGIDDPSSPTQEVDHLIDAQFEKGTHAHPMSSLDNTYNAEELREFEKRIYNILKKTEKFSESEILDYMIELKFDGLGIALTYENGRLSRALTRGNGIEGENITINALQIKNIPKTISETRTLEVRGEVVMPIKSFNELNKYRQEIGENLFANPRNAASGSVRQKDHTVTASRELEFYGYSCPFLEKEEHAYDKLIHQLSDWGFAITPYFKKFSGIDAVISEIESMGEKPTFPFEIDGLVVKADNLDLWPVLGHTAHHPRSAISYKFPAEYSRTKILSIEHSVGRTGTVTPVANVEDVNIGGVTVRRATLHNYEDMEKKGVKIGDQVFIHRAGEVIPEIISPIAELRDGSEETIKIPTHCPICNTRLEKDEGKVAIFCPNPNCPAKVSGNLEWFVSKHGLDIDGLGPQQIKLFQEKGWVTDMASIFDLPSHAEEILELEGYKEKSVSNLVDAINEAQNMPSWKFIAAIAIPGVGKRTAKTIAHLFESESDFLNLGKTPEELEEVKDIGPETAINIVEYFKNNEESIARLLNRVHVTFPSTSEEFSRKSSPILGKSFCVTGSFEGISRDQIHEMIEEHGGDIRTSVSAKLDYLIAGEKAGSKKTKAEGLGVSIIDLEEFQKIIS